MDFNLPKPKNWDGFEDITCEVMSRELHCSNLQRYGRQGQRQNGVDILGVIRGGVVGIQCKHFDKTTLTTKKIDDEVEKAEEFSPKLTQYYIITSDDRDVKTHSYVTQLNLEREIEGKFLITLYFWEELVYKLKDYPDLLSRFYSFLGFDKPIELTFPIESHTQKQTIQDPGQEQLLKEAISKTLVGADIVTKYELACGLSTFPDTNLSGIVDLQFALTDLFQDETKTLEDFDIARQQFKQLRALIVSDLEFYSQRLWVNLNARLTPAFLFGSIFRKVTGFDLILIANGKLWSTTGLADVPHGIIPGVTKNPNADSDEIAVILNISRDIDPKVYEFINASQIPLKRVVSWELPNHQINTPAQALSLSMYLSKILKSYIDKERITHIHLFGAMPAVVATLLGSHLNAICPISLYFMNSSRSSYILGGTIYNNL